MLLLVKNGVPWEVARGFDDTELMGFCISLGSLEGREFDWTGMQWKSL